MTTVGTPVQNSRADSDATDRECRSCGTPAVDGDVFCGGCGTVLPSTTDVAPGAAVVAAPHAATVPPAVADVDTVTALAGKSEQRPASHLVAPDVSMCPACGADLSPTARICGSCGAPPPVVAPESRAATPIGSLHRYRKGLRKRLAIRIGVGNATSTLLRHDGTREELPDSELPTMVTDSATDSQDVGLSGLGLLLRRAVAIDAEQVSLPWTAEDLFGPAFARIGSNIAIARAVALDVLALGRGDLLDRCGLSRTEVTWLRLVDAARNGELSRVVDAATELPVDRYRHKIGVLAALIDRLTQVPQARTRLTPVLAPFADEPLAASLLRRLNGASTVQQRLADLLLLADRLAAPEPLRTLVGHAVDDAFTVDDAMLLGGRGRVAVVHGDPATASRLLPGCDIDQVPLSVVDDLIDAGVVELSTCQRGGREAPDSAYLTARLAPELLTDEQVAALGHHEEALRRATERGDNTAVETAAHSPLRDHLTAVAALARRRPEDVALDRILPSDRAAAQQFVAVLTAADSDAVAAHLGHPLLDDRTTWLPLVNTLGINELRSMRLAPDLAAFADWLALIAARERLFLADWSGAAAIARQCYANGQSETIRDEAQNLLACALHNLGDDAGAMRELSSAIEGEYSVALLANIGVVAARLDPELAARQLARVAREAPTLAMRMNAARQAIVVWKNDESRIWQGESQEDGDRLLPIVLREPLRAMVNAAVSEDDFRTLVAVLSRYDAEWLLTPQSLAASPHKNSLAARFHRAEAKSDMFTSVLDVLAEVTDWDSAPQWLTDKRDRLIEQTADFLSENIDDPDNVAGVVALGLVRKVRGIPQRQRVLLALLGVATVTFHLSAQDEEIADHLVELFNTTRSDVAKLAEEDRDNLDNLVTLTLRRIALNHHDARARELRALIDPYNNALRVLGGVQSGTPLWFTARRQVAETVEACRAAYNQLDEWLVLVDSVDIRRLLAELINEARDFEAKGRRVLES